MLQNAGLILQNWIELKFTSLVFFGWSSETFTTLLWSSNFSNKYDTVHTQHFALYNTHHSSLLPAPIHHLLHGA